MLGLIKRTLSLHGFSKGRKRYNGFMLGRRDRRLSDRARGGLLSIFCSKVWDSYFIKLVEFHILLFLRLSIFEGVLLRN